MAIARLCDKELIYPLARDIAKYGLNRMGRFALLPYKGKPGTAHASYIAADGNRRLCALKLLDDPDLAPAKLRKAFETLAKDSIAPRSVPAAVFDDVESANFWLERIHSGLQGGVGQKDWDADQKQRFDGGGKNKVAQALLDYAEAEKMISAEDRQGKLTTVQRFVGNDVFSEVLGLDRSNPDNLGRTRPKAEFDNLVKRFIRDLVKREDVNSRMNKEEIIRYARPLGSMAGVTQTRIEAESLTTSATTGATGKTRNKKPKKPEKAKKVRFEDEIFSALKALGNEKLSSLYYSICSIDLDPHTPIVAIGTWSFIETLTACAGRGSTTSIDGFFSKAKLISYGITGETLSVHNAVVRIREYGNTTKHHPELAHFNGDTLNNDMRALKAAILKCIEEAAAKSK